MKIGFVGAGRMGRPMVARLVEAGHDVNALGSTAAKVRELERLGANGAQVKLVNNALFAGRIGLLAEAIRLGGRLATSRVLNIVLASRHWSRPPAKI